MKRKIGIIVALVLAFVGVAVLGGDKAGALGPGEKVTYCMVRDDNDAIKKCAVVLAYFHTSEEDWTKVDNVKKHVEANVNYYEAKSKGKTEGEIQSSIWNRVTNAYKDNKITLMGNAGLDQAGLKHAIDACSSYPEGNGRTECVNAKALPSGFDDKAVGMNLAPVCYTDYYKYTSSISTKCTGSAYNYNNQNTDPDNPSGGDSGSGSSSAGSLDTDVPGSEKCSTLFPNEWCSADGIGSILTFVVAVLTGTVVVAGTVGIIICAVLILTARDNEQQLATGKKRLMEVVIGMIAWIMLSVLVNLFIPKTSKKIETEAQNAMIINGGEEKA